MVKVEMELEDIQEMNGFTNFVKQVMDYRFANTPEGQAAIAAATGPEAIAAADAARQEPPAPSVESKVIASITPESKPPTEQEMQTATQAYMKAKGIDKALELVRKYGAAKVTDIKDQAKRTALYIDFMAGLK